MKEKKVYIRPQTEVVILSDPLMLDLPVSGGFVDDEAAKGYNGFDEEENANDYNLWGDDDD